MHCVLHIPILPPYGIALVFAATLVPICLRMFGLVAEMNRYAKEFRR